VEDIERVRCGEGKDAVGRVPGCVEHFVAEVENVDGYLILLAFVTVADAARL